MYSTLLFDMDGTLIDSAEGVYRSLNHALTSAGLSPIPRDEAKHFLGPPLEEALQRFLGLQGEQLIQVQDGFAAHYQTHGLQHTVPVAGMPELCVKLKERGVRLAIATCKPWAYCKPTLTLCQFSDCFDVISGSFHNGIPEDKQAVIQEALRLLGVSPDEALMIGDRGIDVIGAKACGLACVGVEFCGYGASRELEEAGALAVVQTVDALEDYLLTVT